MTTLFTARRTQADGTNGPRHHIVGMFLVSLNVGTKFQVDMFAIVKVFAIEEVSWGERLRHTIRGQEGIQPKHRIGHKMNNHEARDSFKSEQVVTTPGMVFGHVNVTLNFLDVFILSTKVETDVPKAHLKGLKLGVGKSGCNAEAMVVIGLNHMSEGSSHSWNLTAWERFHCTKVKSMRDSDQEGKFIDKHEVMARTTFWKCSRMLGGMPSILPSTGTLLCFSILPFRAPRFGPKMCSVAAMSV